MNSRAFRASLRVLLATALVLTTAGPASARTVDVKVQASSPTQVTVGHAVAYPVSAANLSRSTLNHVELTADAHASFTYLGASSSACSLQVPVCVFGQVAAGASLPPVTFYFLAPMVRDTYEFTATVTLNEGPNDNPGNDPAVQDSFTSDPVLTHVLDESKDFVTGHAFGIHRFFSTGLDSVGVDNPHGSEVIAPFGEVSVQDVAPEPDGNCPAEAPSCFGWGTELSVAGGIEFRDTGIEVTIRWDASQLPKGMTDRKLRIVHEFDGGGSEPVTVPCTFTGSRPDFLPCIKSAPQKQSDKDIQATILLLRNGVIRGW